MTKSQTTSGASAPADTRKRRARGARRFRDAPKGIDQRWDGNTVAVFDATARARVGLHANQWLMLLSVNLLPVGGMFTDAISVLLILLLVPARLDGLALTIVFPQLALWLPGRLGYL